MVDIQEPFIWAVASVGAYSWFESDYREWQRKADPAIKEMISICNKANEIVPPAEMKEIHDVFMKAINRYKNVAVRLKKFSDECSVDNLMAVTQCEKLMGLADKDFEKLLEYNFHWQIR